jgi:hypothetical protein
MLVTAADKAMRPERYGAAAWLPKPVEASTTAQELARILDAA